jgi:tetratricopeptide (TPR) repeat protein
VDENRHREAKDLVSKGRFNEALSILNKSKQESAKDPEAFYLLGVTHFRLGDFSAAESEMRKAISLDPSRADAFYYLGLAAERQMRKDDALKAYKTALALDPTMQKAREKVGELSGMGTDASSNTIVQKAGAKPAKSELFLPETEAEFSAYEDQKRRKEEIDQRAERDARVKLLHEVPQVISRLPWWEKAGMAVMAGIFALFLILALMMFVYHQRFQEEFQRTQKEFHGEYEKSKKYICDQAKQMGRELPGC